MPKPKVNRLHDWFFGGPGKRLLLIAVLTKPGPWSEAALAREAELTRGSAAPHLAALSQAGVVVEENGRYKLCPDAPLAAALQEVLVALDDLPDEELRK